jgi:predicted helicase
MTIQNYVSSLNTRYKTGISREHSYRSDLQVLISSLAPNVLVTNEPARVACGAPDYIITKGDIPIGYIEAKDIGADLTSKTHKEQFDRYRQSLNNLIITDYLNFHLYRDGNLITKISIGEVSDKGIKPYRDNFEQLNNLLADFCRFEGQMIKGSRKLAEMMASKARLLADVIEQALSSDETKREDSSLKDQYYAFKQILIHDITPRGFADVYAQTIAYGMFAARLHDTSLETFSRQEAAELIPKSNPFLRKLFQYIAGYDLDDRIKWIVDALAEIFRATNVGELLKDFGKATQQHDPMIHFYETFLSEYDPKLRKARGVWYTPQPVVDFIVRAVDDILKAEFDLPMGLADTSKVKIKVKDVTKATADLRSKTKIVEKEEEVHRVQILDPATGTGTFLAQVVKHIHKSFEGQAGIWNSYVENHLIPRLNGFEILMASYAMAHLKLELLLAETGFKPTRDQRLRVYLTNSLEEHHPDTGTLFASWLSNEASEANQIKRDTPVMCVIGNPPYSISSTNKGEWIQKLIEIYKANLNERKINIDDDYIKFIRYGQHFIDKNGYGVLAYISNNSFIDGVTHRQMRYNLLGSFDKVYILNLHGNSKKKEVCPDGSADQNVFDIMQGVSINIFIKTGKKRKTELGKVFSYDLQGKREFKYETLLENSISGIKWVELQFKEPYYFFVPKNFDEEKGYNKGFKVNELLINNNTGIQTKCDELSIQFDQTKLKEVVEDFKTLDIEDLKRKYSNKTDSSGWNFIDAVNDLKQNKIYFTKILYRPFDIRFTLYTGKSSGFIGRPRTTTMAHMVNGNNLGLITLRINGELMEYVCLITDHIIEKGSLPKGNYSLFPLYIYPATNGQQTIGIANERTPNLNIEIVNQIAEKLNLTFTIEKETTENTFAPIDILDYIYAVLHSPTYREKYKEFLKIDFPRVPYPTDKETFWQLVKLGGELRQIHLLEHPIVDKRITTYPMAGSNVVEKPTFEDGKVWINQEQHFDGVPQVAWEFYIGGYQPAQKWLKDRKGRELTFEDILHYQKIIVALTETDRLMKEVDGVNFIE